MSKSTDDKIEAATKNDLAVIRRAVCRWLADMENIESGITTRPKVITLCGSTRFKEAFERANRDLTLQGVIVISVGLFGHREAMDMDGPVKTMLDELHFRKIDISDGIFVINQNRYIGASTTREIEYARRHGKSVEYLEQD